MQWGQKEYDNLVDESIPHVNNEKTIHVYFTKAGIIQLDCVIHSLNRLYILTQNGVLSFRLM